MTDIMGSADPYAATLKRELTEIITWAERHRPRSVQVELGPSDLGSECDRRIGYKIAGVPAVNDSHDPWAAFVGSAIHSRLQESIDKYEDVVVRGLLRQEGRYLTEHDAPLDGFIKAHPDLYDRERQMVIDHKSAGTDVLKKFKAGDPFEVFPGYIIQVQLYGLAFENLGYPVKKVALAFYPRSGRLKDMFCWVTDYDRDLALIAYQRPYDIVALLTDLGLPSVSSAWSRVPAVSSNACGYCPWYDPKRSEPADGSGCPGT